MTTRSLLVLTPTRGGVAYCDDYAQLAVSAVHRGIKLARCEDTTPGLLDLARANLLGRACASDATHALFLDADTRFPHPGLVLDLLDRPELERDAIVRTYRIRHPDTRRALEYARDHAFDGDVTERGLSDALYPFPVRPHIEGGRLVWNADRTLLQMVDAGFGFALFRTDALRVFADELRARNPRLVQRTRWGVSVHAFDTSTPHVPCRHGSHGQPVQDEHAICGSEDLAFWLNWCLSGRACWLEPFGAVANGSGAAGPPYAEYLREAYSDSFVPASVRAAAE